MVRLRDIERMIKEGGWKEALAASQDFVQNQPAVPEGHALLGDCLSYFGNLQAAAECYRRSFILKPHNWRAGIKLAECLDRLGRYAEALEVAEQTAKDRPSDERVLGLVRGLKRHVPEKDLEGWQVSQKQSWWMIDLKGPEEEE